MLSLCTDSVQDFVLTDVSKGDAANRSYSHRILDGMDHRRNLLQPFPRDEKVTSLGVQDGGVSRAIVFTFTRIWEENARTSIFVF